MAKEKYFPYLLTGLRNLEGVRRGANQMPRIASSARREVGGQRIKQQMKARESITRLDIRRTGRDHEDKLHESGTRYNADWSWSKMKLSTVDDEVVMV